MDPDALVLELVELVQRAMGPAIALELRLHDGTWPVLCDPNQLESALLNLAINARDAMPDGGRLAISTRHVQLSEADVADQQNARPGDCVEITVGDTGIGMAPEVMGRAFEPFFTTKPIGQGTGLGLSQLHGFVRCLGGVLRLESTPGRGTTVRFCLPRHTSATPANEIDVSPRPATITAGMAVAGTVLLVEDEAATRRLMAEALCELGCQVIEVEDSANGLRVLQASRERVDLLVTDVGLPGMDGRRLAEVAREHRPGLPVLFITGYAGAMLDKKQLAPGMELMCKPFTLNALAGRV